MKKKLLLLIPAGLAIAVGVVACQTSRAGYESAPYTVVRTVGRMELRDYPALTVVETAMPRDSREQANSGFSRLFRFITGSNTTGEKIAMTTPVFMSDTGTQPTMAFVMPTEMKSGALPRPTDPTLSIRELPAGRFGVLRFTGTRSAQRENTALTDLRQHLAAENLITEGTPVYGFFDPPWTPGFLRRNEVMLRLTSQKP